MVLSQNAKVWLLIFFVLIAGGFNRVFYKILITPITNSADRLSYAFFLSTCNAIFYVLVYGTICYLRWLRGDLKHGSFSYPWSTKYFPPKRNLFVTTLPPLLCFVCIGAFDGLGGVLGLLAAPYISGVMISMMLQSIILFSMIASILLLKSRYSLWQIIGIFVVLCGAMLTLLPDILGGKLTSSSDVQVMSTRKYIGYHILMACSTFPHAISFTLREVLFVAHPELDVFIVNLHASLWQAILSPILITLTVSFNILLNQTQQQGFYDFLLNGMQCILLQRNRMPDNVIQCSALRKPLWPRLPISLPYVCYITCNLCLNISLINLVKKASSLQSFMTLKAILPVAVTLFFFKWPMLDPQTPSLFVVGGLGIVLLGLVIFRQTTILRDYYRTAYGEEATYCFSMLPFHFRAPHMRSKTVILQQ